MRLTFESAIRKPVAMIYFNAKPMPIKDILLIHALQQRSLNNINQSYSFNLYNKLLL
jgi:hypothetical protein